MLTKLFRQTGIPSEYRTTFQHLYWDIAWFGVLSGSTVNFLNIYATRLGASGFQIGLISAMTAVVSLFLAIPSGRWLQTRSLQKAIFRTSVFYRVWFVAFILLPWLFAPSAQISAIILITFVMAIPLTPLGVGFNALFAEAVPMEYRAHVAGLRNVMLAITFMLTSLLSGYLLDRLPFPLGYQVVFAIGALGAAMSSFHLYFVRPTLQSSSTTSPTLNAQTEVSVPVTTFRTALRLDIWQTRFRRILLGLLAFHLTQYLAIPIFPLYYVNILNLSDDQIGIGTAFFYLSVLLGSTRLRSLVYRFGNQSMTAWGVVGMSVYPFLLSQADQVWHFYGISLFGGFVFALLNGSYANYMLEHIPAHDRPPHLAWYNVILNAAILIGSLTGPLFADWLGLSQALLLFAGLRFLAGLVIFKWG